MKVLNCLIVLVLTTANFLAVTGEDAGSQGFYLSKVDNRTDKIFEISFSKSTKVFKECIVPGINMLSLEIPLKKEKMEEFEFHNGSILLKKLPTDNLGLSIQFFKAYIQTVNVFPDVFVKIRPCQL